MNQVNFPLSNVQMELMKLYATDLSNTDLLELKQQLAKFYAEKSIKAAEKVHLTYIKNFAPFLEIR